MRNKKTPNKLREQILTFDTLVQSIHTTNQDLAAQASRAVNMSLTLRNWLFGFFIAEYELNGADRAQYGDKLLDNLAEKLSHLQVSNCNRRQLYRYLRFYRLFPEIVGTLPPQFKNRLIVSLTDHCGDSVPTMVC